MKQIAEISTFTPKDKICRIPYSHWSGPLLDFLVKWKITILTCEQEVFDLVQDQTKVVFTPPILQKIKGKGKKTYEVGILANWANAFESKTNLMVEKLLREMEGKQLFIGEPTAFDVTKECQAIFPIQNQPALTPQIVSSLYAEIHVLMPEESKAFFPPELPIRYYNQDNLKMVYEEAISNPDYLKDKTWSKVYTKKEVEKRALKQLETDKTETNKGSISDAEWATFLLVRGDIHEAEKSFVKIRESLDPLGLNNYGVCLAGLGKIDEAKEILHRSGSLASKFNLGEVLFQEKKQSEALVELQAFLASSENPIGLILWSQSNAEAVRFLKLMPSNPERAKILRAKALHEIGAIYWENEKRGEALQSLKDAIALDSTNPLLLYRLAVLNIEKGMVAQPIKTLNESLKSYPFFFEAAHLLAGFYTQVELHEQAAQLIDKYLKFPQSMNLLRNKMLNLRSYLFYQMGDTQNALAYMQGSLKEDPNQPELEEQLSVIYLKQGVEAFEAGDFVKAEALAEKSLSHDPTQTYSINLKGSIAYRQADYDEAEKYFKKALSIDPELDVTAKNLSETEDARQIMVSLIVLSHNDINSAIVALRAITDFSDLPYEIIYLRPKNAEPWEFLNNIPKLRELKEEFSGSAQAYNYGAVQARGKYMFFMEDDVVVSQEWLSRLVSALEGERVGIIGPLTNNCGNPEQTGIVKDTTPFEVSFVDGFCLGVKREFLKEVGAFDDGFIVRGLEDRDLSLRAKIADWKLFCHPGVFVSHAGLMPVLPPDPNLAEIDGHNVNHFKQKWESVQMQAAAK